MWSEGASSVSIERAASWLPDKAAAVAVVASAAGETRKTDTLFFPELSFEAAARKKKKRQKDSANPQ